MKKVELITSESGDWAVIKIDGKSEYEGHSIADHQWLEILMKAGIEVSSKEVSNEDMEEGNF